MPKRPIEGVSVGVFSKALGIDDNCTDALNTKEVRSLLLQLHPCWELNLKASGHRTLEIQA
jgi:hypothetical protein